MIGFIYCIECLETGNKYYGSTKDTLDERIKNHCADIKTYENGNKGGLCESHVIIKKGNYTASVVKEVNFNDKSELLWEERWAIEADPKAINVRKPILTKTKKKELNEMCSRKYAREYYHKHKEECLARNRAYRQTETGKANQANYDKKYREGEHREELLTKKREYHHANKEAIAENKKAYREANAKTIQEKKKAEYEKAKENGLCDPMFCQCGGTYTHRSKTRHFETKKHQNWLKNNTHTHT